MSLLNSYTLANETTSYYALAGSGIPIPGPAGPTGPTGTQGPPGLSILSGINPPTPPIGVTGDLYVDLVTSQLYKKTDAVTWLAEFSMIGPAGTSATINAGTTTTLAPGSPATVTNVGTAQNGIFNFGIPQGVTGPIGATGPQGIPGSDADVSQWATFKAVQGVNCDNFPITNAETLQINGSLLGAGSLQVGDTLSPVLFNNQYAYSTTIQNTSPLNDMNINSAGKLNITSAGSEFNITLVGVAGNDLNITAPDINLTMTDTISLMNLTAPGGVAILGGGGFFMASGVFEVITGLDCTLITAGNIRIGSGNVLGATTQVEKFELNDYEMSAVSGTQFLRFHNVRSIDNVIDGDGGNGQLDLECIARCGTTATSFTDASKTTATTVDANNRQFSIVNNVDPVSLVLETMANAYTTTFLGSSNVVFGTTSGILNMSGITDVSSSTVHCGNAFLSSNLSTATMTIGLANVTDSAFTLSNIAVPSTTALIPSLQGKTFLLTGSPQNFTTAGLGIADAGFFVYAKNVSAGNINVEENGVAIGGTPILYSATGTANASLCLIWWDGSVLRMN